MTSIILLFPLWYIYLNINDIYIFNPPLWGKLFLYFISGFGIFWGYLTSKEYDNKTFLGIEQIKRFFKEKAYIYTDNGVLKTDGVLGIIRHPYYFAGLLVLWGRTLKIKDLIINIIFTFYFIFGALNEERKLIELHGEKYMEYKRKVPMLFPNLRSTFNKTKNNLF
ncbi:methyltransferase family protein [Calditerrivibrio sp.]|uniref:methyltransferase family protein n=1 Tax=Calditerrivibrio sp. TaxID=2792612 RepID=UPI003D09868B